MSSPSSSPGLPDAAFPQQPTLFVSLAGRPIALITHKPLFLNRPADAGAAPHRFLSADAVTRLMVQIATAPVRLVMTGHTHQMRQHRHAGVDFVWAPSTAFVLPDWFQPVMGEKRLGLVDYRFEDDRVAVRFVTPDGMAEMTLPQVATAYGDTNENAARGPGAVQ